MKKIVLFLLNLAFCLPALSQININENDPLLTETKVLPYEWSPGQSGKIEIKMSLPEGFHAYEDKFRVIVDEPEGFQTSVIKVSPIKNFFDKFSNRERSGVEGESTLIATLEAPSQFTTNIGRIKVRFTYQACSESFCLFPITKIIEVPILLKGIGAQLQNQETSSLPNVIPEKKIELFSTEKIKELLGGNWIFSLFIVFIAGILTSFTPCIFPMIPITLAILTKDSEKRTRLQNFLLSLTYVHGIATTYSLLGLLAASSGAVFGASLGNPIVLSFVCILFLAMALSMYGAFEIQMPTFIRHHLGRGSSSTGYIGAYFSGLFAGIVASPCVGPVLVTILAFVATTQNKVFGFFLLFSYAMGLGLIFLLLGAFTELTRKLPRSGPWMEGTKFILGSLMLGAFYYYLQLLIPLRWHDGLLGIGLIILASLYGAFNVPHGHNKFPKVKKGLMQGLLVVGIGYLTLGALDLRPYLQNNLSGQTLTLTELDWQPLTEESLSAALKSGQPVMIDFWAEWCAACHELKDLTFTDPRVRALSEKFILLRFDATKDSPEIAKLKARYKIQGLPTVLFYNSKAEWLEALTLTQFEKPDLFVRRMEKAAQ